MIPSLFTSAAFFCSSVYFESCPVDVLAYSVRTSVASRPSIILSSFTSPDLYFKDTIGSVVVVDGSAVVDVIVEVVDVVVGFVVVDVVWGNYPLKKKDGLESLLVALRAVCICEIYYSVAYIKCCRTMCNDNDCLVRHTPEILKQPFFRIGIECRSSVIKGQYRAF